MEGEIPKTQLDKVSEDEGHWDRTACLKIIEKLVPDLTAFERLLPPACVEDGIDKQEEHKCHVRKMHRIKGKRWNKLYKVASEILAEKQLITFYLYYVVGLSEREIAKYRKVSQPIVNVTLHNSVMKLKKALCP